MSSKRPGQVRFEAWVPEDLYRAFQQKVGVGGRKAWLVGAIREFTFGPDGCTHTKRVQVGTRESLGQTLPVHACADCGQPLT
jgi:hypothetical protein